MKNVLLALGMMAAISPAMASTGNSYFGGSIGQTELSMDSEAKADIQSIGGSIDNEDMGYKVFLGYRANEYAAMEVSYADLGETKISTNIYNASIKSNTLALSGIGILPITPSFELFGKLGFHMWDSSLDDSLGNSITDDGVDLVYGIGLSYKLDVVSFRGEIENYMLDGADVDMISLGVSIGF